MVSVMRIFFNFLIFYNRVIRDDGKERLDLVKYIYAHIDTG